MGLIGEFFFDLCLGIVRSNLDCISKCNFLNLLTSFLSSPIKPMQNQVGMIPKNVFWIQNVTNLIFSKFGTIRTCLRLAQEDKSLLSRSAFIFLDITCLFSKANS